jgi:hypothetical protein
MPAIICRTICRAVFASPATELSDGDSSRIPPEAHSIRFKGQDLNAAVGTAYFAGIGYLADLVRLYSLSGESLFAKNVRFYLRRQEQSGPAKYMRQTLRGICIDRKLPPEQFAILHNGVTLHAVSAKVTPDTLELRPECTKWLPNDRKRGPVFRGQAAAHQN